MGAGPEPRRLRHGAEGEGAALEDGARVGGAAVENGDGTRVQLALRTAASNETSVKYMCIIMTEYLNEITRGIRNPGVWVFCTADFWSSLAYESTEKTQTLPNSRIPDTSDVDRE